MSDSEKPKLSNDQIKNIYSPKSVSLLHQDQVFDAEQVKIELKTQKKKQYHINFLEKLGLSTSLVGWFYLLLIPALVFLFGWSGSSRQLIFYYSLLIVPICAVFIISGKYITYNGGALTKFFLAFNSVIGILTLPTFLSGIIGIQSLMAYFYYKKEMNSSEPIPYDQISARPKIFTIVLIILLSAAGGYVLMTKNPSNPMFGPIGFLSDITNNRFSSRDLAFSIDMRYRTTVKKDFDSIGFNKTPNTSYICGTQDIGYVVIDHDYSSFKDNLNIDSTINEIYSLTSIQLGAEKANDNFSTFKGLRAKFADFSFIDSQVNREAKSYYLSFIKNKHIYEIYTISLTKNDFQRFIDSIEFQK